MRKIISYTALICLFASSCKQKIKCKELEKQYPSYDSVIAFIEQNSYTFKDSLEVKKGREIKLANFYSCDKKTGVFVFRVNIEGRKYFRSHVPLSIWNDFKMSADKDSFFYKKINVLNGGDITVIQEAVR